MTIKKMYKKDLKEFRESFNTEMNRRRMNLTEYDVKLIDTIITNKCKGKKGKR